MKNCIPCPFIRYYAVIISLICSSYISAQTLHTESFDNATFPPAGWQQGGGNTGYVNQVTAGNNPAQSPHSGAGEVEFNSYNLTSGTTLLISPVIDWSNLGTDSAAISFWFYRDGTSYLDSGFANEGVQLLVNTSPTDAGAVQLGFVSRVDTFSPAVNSTGWYQYTYYVPTSFNTSSNYFILKFISADGDNCYLDDVSWQSFATPCTGTPSPGTISSSASPVCPSSAFTLTLSGSTVADGITYQWQSSTDSSTWNNITGDTTTSITDTLPGSSVYYRVIVSCSNSGMSAPTAGFLESLNTFSNCYCVPASSNCNLSDVITNISFAGINNSSSCGTNGYTSYNQTGTVYKTLTYPLAVSVDNGGTENVSAWIDYDHNGSFDASEYVAVGSGTGGVTFTNNINIPATAITGVTRMRVRDQYGSQLPSSGACDAVTDGETEDYLVDIQPAPVCTDPPAPGVITGGGAICVSDSLTLTLTGQTLGTTTQWQSSTDSVNFTDIAGALNSYYTTPPITDSVYYRVKVSCSSTVYTPVIKISVKPGYLCYCSEPDLGGGTSCGNGYEVQSVSIPGTSLFSLLVCNTSNGYVYSQLPDSGNYTAQLYAPATYSIVAASTDGEGYMSAWIDYNHDGVFDASENIFADVNTSGAFDTFSFSVPPTALLGATGLRIRSSSGTITGSDACTYLYDGETEDYTIHIAAAPACTGAPSAGTIVSNSNPTCLSSSFMLTTQNITIAGGLTYQWQSSPDSLNWADITGDTTNVSTDSISANTYYRFIVTCTGSGLSDTTSVFEETVSSFFNCYCIPQADCGASDVINNVTFAGINNSSGCGGSGYTFYSDTALVSKTVTYPIAVGVDDGGTENVNVWIDYNHNGIFEASEYTAIGSGQGGVTFTNNIFIPSNALTGITAIRVRDNYGSTNLTGTDACTDIFDGETEDYLVNITDAPICTNPPVAGTISGSNSVCSGGTVTLSLSGQTLGTRTQWQVSTDSVTFTDINGALNSTYTTGSITDSAYYRVKVICSDSTYTNIIKVSLNPFYYCYCVPQADCNASDVINNVTFAGINNSSGCGGNGYTAYNDTALVYKTLTYPVSVGVDDGGTENVYAWIDYNHDGVFEASEYTAIGSGEGGVTFTNNITIPSNALTGITAMRVRDKYGSAITDTDACTDVADGETEDYLVNIMDAPTCTNPPVAGTISGNTAVCSGGTVTLTLSGQTLGTRTQWQVSTDSVTFTDINGALSSTYTTGPVTDSAYYRVKVTCADSVYTSVVKVSLNPAYLCGSCAVQSNCGLDDEITNVTFAGINNTSTCGNNGYTNYNLTASVQPSSNYAISVSVNNGGNENTFVWIDYNHNGVYDSSEFTAIGSGTGGVTFTNTVNIPANALTGITTMRVRDQFGATPLGAGDACTSVSFGETEDYLVNIQSVPCTSAPVAGTASGPTSAVPGDTVTFTTTGSSGALQWIYSTNSATGPFVSIPGADSATFEIQVPAEGAYWIAVVASNPGCTSDTSNVIHGTAVLPADDVCNALPLTMGANGPYSTVFASVETGEPYAPAGDCHAQNAWCNTSLQNTLWFTFVAPASGRISINTVSFDTKIAVWNAPTCDTVLHSGATLLAANDNDANAVAHGINANASYIDSVTCLTAGNTYYVQVLPASGVGDTTSIMLRDLGPGPNPAFVLAPHFCLPADSVMLTSATGGGIFSGPGVTGSVFNPNTAGVGGPFVITDSLGNCYVSHDTVSISRSPQLILTNNTVGIACYGDNTGSVSVSAFNGTPAYVFVWSNGDNTDSINQVSAGSYSVTVTDAAGCVAQSDTVNIVQPDSLYALADSIIPSNCQDAAIGAVYVHGVGGTGQYTYNWTGGATTQNLTGLIAQNYTVTVTDSSGCHSTGTFTVTKPDVFTVTTNITDQQQGGSLGSITQSVSGGTAPYTYAWSNGATTQNLTGLQSGIYTSTITDLSGCLVITTDTVKLLTGVEVLDGGITLSIFPNPSQSHVYIDLDLPNAENVTLQVYDVNARMVRYEEQNAMSKVRFDVDLSQQASGIYLAKIKAGDAIITRRIVLTK